MRRFGSAVAAHSDEVDLPAVVEELLADVITEGFQMYCCGPKTAANALVACYEYPPTLGSWRPAGPHQLLHLLPEEPRGS